MKRGEVRIKSLAITNVNKSHACAYSFISLCTMFLKTFFKVQFFAALLSLQEKPEKVDLYCKMTSMYGIEVLPPDINKSESNFIPYGNKILFGLKNIKGVGEGAVPFILEHRPYSNIEDAYSKVGTKYFNKRIGEALIKTGAFDFSDSNRNLLLNSFIELRKASKKEEFYSEDKYGEKTCIKYETELLGTSLTYKPYWDTVFPGEKVSVELNINSIREKIDRRGNMMAFIDVAIKDCEGIKGVVFASIYCKNHFEFTKGAKVLAQIEKDDNGGFILKKLLKELPATKLKKTKKKTVNLSEVISSFDKALSSI